MNEGREAEGSQCDLEQKEKIRDSERVRAGEIWGPGM